MAKASNFKKTTLEPRQTVGKNKAPKTGKPAVEDAGMEGSAAGLGKPIPEEEENKGYEEARRQRIAAKIARIGVIHAGMLPTELSILWYLHLHRFTFLRKPKEEATPCSTRRDTVLPCQPAVCYHDSEQEYEQPSSSDDGVQAEAEESEFEEEVGHKDLKDGCDNRGVEGDKIPEDGYDNGGVDGETPVVGCASCAGQAPLAFRRMD